MNKLLKAQKGQSLVETAGVMGLLALIALAIWIVIGPAVSEGFAMAVGNLDLSNGHGGERHGFGTVAAINDCFEKGGSVGSFINRQNGRKADVCLMPDGKYSVRIIEKNTEGGWRMVTAFVKEKLKTFSDVARYLGNQGYDPIQ
jgi:putative hemolysin